MRLAEYWPLILVFVLAAIGHFSGTDGRLWEDEE